MAEAKSEYTVRETAAYYAMRVERLRDDARQNGWKLRLPDVVALDSIMAFLERVARDDLDIFAAVPGGESNDG